MQINECLYTHEAIKMMRGKTNKAHAGTTLAITLRQILMHVSFRPQSVAIKKKKISILVYNKFAAFRAESSFVTACYPIPNELGNLQLCNRER